VATPADDQATKAPGGLNLEQALVKARVEGKYRMLLRQFKVEKDAETYQDFKDLGQRDVREYAGQTDLPKGYWVYVKPYWYVWRDLAAVNPPKRAWGPEQATGEPDTDGAGDIQTAWASASQDDQDEWLMLEYAEPVVPTAVLVHETFNPGALYRVTAYKLDGEEVEVWKGTDPTPTDADRGVSEIPVKIDFKTNRIRIFLASKAVPGWNEIDAVGLRSGKGTLWAVAADASSTYASNTVVEPPVPQVVVPANRLMQLEDEVRKLRAELDELKKMLKKDGK
jgi:hypothetical protein